MHILMLQVRELCGCLAISEPLLAQMWEEVTTSS